MGKLFAIARITSVDGKVLGYKLLDKDSKATKDVSVLGLRKAISGGAKVENVKLVGDLLFGTNGSLDRYASIGTDRPKQIDLAKKNPIVILDQVEDVGFTISDCYGNVKRRLKDKVVSIVEINGIANGKLVEKDGTKFISAISGEYDRVAQDDSSNRYKNYMQKLAGTLKTEVEPVKVLVEVKEAVKEVVVKTEVAASASKEIVVNNPIVEELVKGKSVADGFELSNPEKLVASIIDSQKYSEKTLARVHKFLANKTDTDDMVSFYMGSLGGELLGCKLKKTKSGIRFVTPDKEYRGKDFSTKQAIPADELISITSIENKNTVEIRVIRLLFGPKISEDVYITDTIYVEGGKVMLIDTYIYDDKKAYSGSRKYSRAKYAEYKSKDWA